MVEQAECEHGSGPVGAGFDLRGEASDGLTAAGACGGVEVVDVGVVPRHGRIVGFGPCPHPDRVRPAVRGDGGRGGRGEPGGAVVGMGVFRPWRQVGVGLGEQGPQHRAELLPVLGERGVGKPEPVHRDVGEPLHGEGGVELGPAAGGEVVACGGVELGVGGLAVGGDDQGERCPGGVQVLEQATDPERLVVGVGRDDDDAAVGREVEHRQVGSAAQGIVPGCGRGDRWRAGLGCGGHRRSRIASSAARPAAAWSRAPWCWRM